jgi:radical SAM superfamily enzyme YgiQ (UPF0313 family)
VPHVSFVTFTGLRIHEQRLAAAGMTLPGLASRAHAVAELPSLALLTLAGMLPEHWTCSYHDSTCQLDSLAAKLVDEQPDLVAISALTASVIEAYRLASMLRNRGLRVVLGGLHATACPDEAQQYCDSVVVGQGETVWPQLLADVERNELQPVYRTIASTKLSTWPTPRFELLAKQPQRFTLQTARGCPLACEFCAASRLLGPFSEKPLANIENELRVIRTLCQRPVIELADDNTFVGSRNVESFFEVFASAGVRYFTEADWRIGTRPDVLVGLAASGCLQVLVGIESLVFRYPGMGQKSTHWHEIIDAIDDIQAAGVAVNGCFIIGGDGETRDSIDRLVQFIAQSRLADVQLTLQTPFPGTSLYNRMLQSGRLLADRDWSHYTLFDVTYQPDNMSVEELETAFFDALAVVYSPSETRRRDSIRRTIWKQHRHTKGTPPWSRSDS